MLPLHDENFGPFGPYSSSTAVLPSPANDSYMRVACISSGLSSDKSVIVLFGVLFLTFANIESTTSYARFGIPKSFVPKAFHAGPFAVSQSMRSTI